MRLRVGLCKLSNGAVARDSGVDAAFGAKASAAEASEAEGSGAAASELEGLREVVTEVATDAILDAIAGSARR